jgi:poly(A) polymerase
MAVREALQKLSEAGHVSYIVGGSVRDFLLEKENKDHDIATSADPNELCRLFPNAFTVGKAFGVIKVPVDGGRSLLEIATFRKDLEYEDNRRPVGVVFSDAYEDAIRRDFTINALFFDPKTMRILDATGGLDDLRDRVIRAIGDPHKRFREDALRLLRGVRFQANLGFRMDSETAQAIRTRARFIGKVSAERIRDELTLMIRGPRVVDAVLALSDLELLKHVLPEVEAVRTHGKPLWNRYLKMLKVLAQKNPKRNSVLAWAAVLHDIGKPKVAALGKGFAGYESEGGRLAKGVAQRFKMSRAEVDSIGTLVGTQAKFREVFQMRESTLERFLRLEHFEDLLALHEADAICSDGNLAYFEFCKSRFQSQKPELPVRLVDGTDLIQLGLSPGPEFSRILRVLEDMALEKKLSTKVEALEYVVKNFVR